MPGRNRYEQAEQARVTVPDGLGGTREVAYLLPRALPDPATTIAMGWHRVGPDDRVDTVAARYLGDPAAFWRICDANLAVDPDALVGPDAEGAVIVIPVPGA